MTSATQSLKEFVDNLLSDVASGSISVYEAISAASQYAYLREALASKKDLLGQAEIMGENDLIKAFDSVVSRAAETLTDLPNFQSQLPDRALQEQEVRERGNLRKHAALRIQEASQTALGGQKNQRRAFIHDLVNRFSSTVPTATESYLGPAVDRALIAAAGEATSQQTKERFAELLIASSGIVAGGVMDDRATSLKTEILSALTADDAYVSGVIKQNKRDTALVSALYDRADMVRPDVFIDVVLNAPSTEAAPEVFLRAEKLAGVAASLENRPNREGGRLQFFSAGGTRGIAKGLQQGADGVLSLVGEPVREMIIHEKINGTLRSMLANTQHFVDRLGEGFVHSALFTHIAQDAARQLSEKPSGGQARTVFDDVFSSVFRGPYDGQKRAFFGTPLSSVFRGPLNPALTQGTKERILDYFELARANAAAPKGKAFLPQNIPLWEIFRATDQPRTGGGAAQSVGSLVVPRGIAWFPMFGLASLNTALGNTLGLFVDRTTSFFLTNPYVPRQLSHSRRAAAIPIPISQDMPLLTALLVVGVLVLLFIFPSPLNLSQLSHSSKASAILSALYNTVSGGTTLSCANISGAHVKQNDPRWGNVTCKDARPDVPACKDPTACTIGASGCGTTSATIILKAFGVSTTVEEQWDKQHKATGFEYRGSDINHPYPYCLSYHEAVGNLIRDKGLSVEGMGSDPDEIERVLEACGLVLALVDEMWSSGDTTSHFLVISGITHEGGVTKVTTLDPMRDAGFVSTVTTNPAKDGDIVLKELWKVTK